MKKGWFSIGKSKEKKPKPPKEEKTPKDSEKEKRNALYSLFLKDTKEKKKQIDNAYDVFKASQNQTDDNGKNGNKNNANKNKNTKSSNKDNVQPKKSIEQMIGDLDEKEFLELIANIKQKFPKSNITWLNEAACYLASKIPSNVKDVLNVLNNNLDYPANLMKESFKKELINLFKLYSKEELYQVQMSILETSIPEIYLTQVSGSVGYLLFLQCIALHLGQSSNENVERLASPAVRNKHKEKPNLYLTQIWCLQSVGLLNLKAGLEIWKKLYEPQLEHKYFHQFALKYLGQILDNNSNYKDAQGVLNIKDLMRILQLKVTSENQDLLKKILPKFKLVCLNNLNDQQIVNSFNELITNLNAFKSETSSQEFIISCLVFCLDHNKTCFDIWFEHHKTHCNNEDLLLEHLISNPNSIQNQKRSFKSTLNKIAKFNDKQPQSKYHSKQIFKTMGKSKSFTSNLAFLLLVALLTYIAYDLRSNGSFERSHSARYLKRWKLYKYVQPVAVKIERNVLMIKKQYDVQYGPTVNFYVNDVVSKYDSNVRPIVDPYLGHMVNISTPLVNSMKENSVIAYRVAEKYYSSYYKQASIFLEKNVFTGPLEIDNLKLVISDSFEKLVNAYTDVWRWAASKFSGLIQQ